MLLLLLFRPDLKITIETKRYADCLAQI